VTPINVTLPAANDQPFVQLRVMTTNAVGSDEWVGVDDLYITGEPIVFVPEMIIEKAGPSQVDIQQSFDYTLSVVNSLGTTATQVVITDSLPISVTIESVSDGGQILPGNVVSWTVPSIADGGLVNRTVSVAAPSQTGTLVNFDYGVWASNWLTFTAGSPVTTTVINSNAITPIAEARAAGVGWYGTLQGNVSVPAGIYRDNAFVIQDETGGMYIYAWARALPPMGLGDVIRIKALEALQRIAGIDRWKAWNGSIMERRQPIITTGNVGNTRAVVQVLRTATWSILRPHRGSDSVLPITMAPGQ
jgi:uncharacterized repeat protein (TIGR01451 family)